MTSRFRPRQGVAAVELAVLLPLLAFLFIISVDWARVFYFSVTVHNCARNGALFASDPIAQAASPYASVSQAALADAANVSPAPDVTNNPGVSAGVPYVEVTVSFPFQTITNFPGVPTTTNIVRTVRMNVVPRTPN